MEQYLEDRLDLEPSRTSVLYLHRQDMDEARAAVLREVRERVRALNRTSGKGHGGCIGFVAAMDALSDPGS